MDDRIQQSKDYIKFHKDRKSGVLQQQISELRESQRGWREQVDMLVKAEIDAVSRRR